MDGLRAHSVESNQLELTFLVRSFSLRLICSDLIARGIDIASVSHVVSYDVPVDMRKYIHRVGRTARAGREGSAWSLVETQEVSPRLRSRFVLSPLPRLVSSLGPRFASPSPLPVFFTESPSSWFYSRLVTSKLSFTRQTISRNSRSSRSRKRNSMVSSLLTRLRWGG